ncbi:MAG: hypothetical protein DWI03_06135 [Planctomycetota bacterium]|jgi:hypothetical protein|nr:MAG: hypothetical protein DWI03_06135 [Planctomycetota bacterium]
MANRRTHTRSPAPLPQRGVPVWLPWVLAPGFLFLPIGGCGAAAAMRRAALHDTAADAPPLVPVATVVTMLPPVACEAAAH